MLNKVLRVRSITDRVIIGGMSSYNDPSMSYMTELFDKDNVKYCTIPFDQEAYSRYLDGLVNCEISTRAYPKNIMASLENLGNMIYPLLNNDRPANKFNTNPYYAVSIALVILHPGFIKIMDTAKASGESIHFLNIIPIVTNNYSYSVIPIILGVWVLSYVEPLIDKITPNITKNFLKPLLILLVIMPVTMIILGPLGAILGELLSKVIYKFYNTFGFVAVGIIGGIYPFIVMSGMHHAFTPIKLGVLATVGYEAFICIGELAANLAQGGAALAVAVKSKNKDFKQIAGSSAFSAIVAGITEPALYGVNVRLKRPMIGACCGAVVGGLFGGFMQMKCFGVATPSFVTIVQYIEAGRSSSIIIALVTILIAVLVSFIITYIIGFEDVVYEDEEEKILERAEILDKKTL